MREQELIERLDKLPTEDKQAFILATIQSYPNFIRFKIRLAYLYSEQGKDEKAIQVLENELAKKYNVHVQITLANIELKNKDVTSAKESIDILRKNNPNTAHTLLLWGRLNAIEGNKEVALTAFRESHQLNPKMARPILELFVLHFHNHSFAEAKAIIKTGLKHKPNDFGYNMRWAQACSALGETEAALMGYKKAKDLATNDTQAGNAALQYAIQHKDKSKEEEIINMLREASQAYPSHAGIRLNFVRYLTNNALYKEALKQTETLQKLAPNDLRVLASKSTILHRQGYNDEAEVICDRVLSQNPTQINSLLLKANLLSAKEEVEKAFIIYQQGINAHPNSPWPYIGMAQLLFKEGNLSEALTILEQGKERAVTIDQINFKRMQFLMHTGEYDLALSLIADQKKSTNAIEQKVSYLEMQLLQRRGDLTKAKQAAITFLNDCPKDSIWNITVQSFLSATAFLDYDYTTSEKILTELVTRAEDTNMLRNRLSLLYILKGDLDNAKQQLKLATQEIETKETSGRVLIPLIGHTAKILNEININPRLEKKAIESFNYQGARRLDFLSKLNAEHPSYFGFSLYLSNELRSQGIFEKIKQSLNTTQNSPSIPKTIIQYWDSENIPASVSVVMNSWKEQNPDFEYKLFSRRSAYIFLKIQLGHNDAAAFLNCEHPAMQADFFRLAYLSKMGGFYSDADDKCVRPLNTLVESKAELVLKLGDFGCISNNFLGCAPGNEIISEAYERGMKNTTTYFNEGPWFKLGPGHLTKSVTYNLAHHIHEMDFSKWPKIYMLDQIDTRKYISQHLSLPYKSSDKSWFTAEYKKTITKTKSS